MKSVTDKPISSLSDDLLDVEVYAQALANFMFSSDTPITVGLQGEWGTGKTSLMAVIQEILAEKSIATSWVNTWEFSLFSDSSQTTPRVLNAMVSKLEESCRQSGNWDIGDEANQKLKTVSKFLSNVANQVVKSKTGIDIKGAAEPTSGLDSEIQISLIKKEIAEIIEKLIASPSNPYQKVVFFVDDLDRIPPADAVEVLEALKNIFDIPHCVFVLAIDYDVVVKGLESKFGPKTELNEREFRSFFDKIIQVPFSMPVGSYDIKKFVTTKLEQMGLGVEESEADDYATIIRYTVGTNPRSLKRYLNSFSLINSVREVHSFDDPDMSELMLFALLGIQISYPQIFRLLTHQSDFTSWSKGFSNRYGMKWDQLKENVTAYEENELLDEDWEQVTWGVGQKDPYLRSRIFDVLSLLNHLRTLFGQSVADQIEKAMVFAAITNVDDDLESKQATGASGKRVRYDGLEGKVQQMTEAGLHPDGIQAFKALFTPLIEASETRSETLKVSLAPTGSSFNDKTIEDRGSRQLLYVFNPKKRTGGITFHISVSSGIRHDVFSLLEQRCGSSDELFSIENDESSLKVEDKIYQALGPEKYFSVLQEIAELLLRSRLSS